MEQILAPNDTRLPAPSRLVTARELLTLPVRERGRILEAAAIAAAEDYRADLAKPVAERELTAFTALDSDLELPLQ